jgi:hypothetical protein
MAATFDKYTAPDLVKNFTFDKIKDMYDVIEPSSENKTKMELVIEISRRVNAKAAALPAMMRSASMAPVAPPAMMRSASMAPAAPAACVNNSLERYFASKSTSQLDKLVAERPAVGALMRMAGGHESGFSMETAAKMSYVAGTSPPKFSGKDDYMAFWDAMAALDDKEE